MKKHRGGSPRKTKRNTKAHNAMGVYRKDTVRNEQEMVRQITR